LPAHGPLKVDALVEALSAEDRLAQRLTSIPPAPASPASSAPGPLRLGPNASFQPLLEQAARRTSLDPGLLAAIIDAEAARRPDGSWNPASRNPRSSASGLGQFLTGTWLDEARRPGSWLAGEAAARGWTNAGGALREGARSALLDLRFDPRASIEAIADHAAANLRRLRAAGVQADSLPDQARAAYLAHHLGLGDALRFLGGGLPEGRASRLLAAQVGEVAASPAHHRDRQRRRRSPNLAAGLCRPAHSAEPLYRGLSGNSLRIGVNDPSRQLPAPRGSSHSLRSGATG
jgi:hypothetical protein